MKFGINDIVMGVNIGDDRLSLERINPKKTKSKIFDGSLEYMVNNHLTSQIEPKNKS